MRFARRHVFALAIAGGLSLSAVAAGQPDEPAAPDVTSVTAPAPLPSPDTAAPAVPPTSDAPAPATEPDAAELQERAFAAVTSGRYREAVAPILLLVVWFVRGRETLPGWFKTDRGGVILVFLLAVVGAVGAAALIDPGAYGTLALWKSAAVVGLQSIGWYVGLRRLLWPPDKTKPSPSPMVT